ncbi:MAG TPA: YihY/virulence factor BrkB family protein [Thermomicrobiales bacterium]|nr:YihY/virulence factor BrkB family protein [Thermomicrobiales bacterium]
MERPGFVSRIWYPVDRARRTRLGGLLERAIRDFTGDHASVYAAAITYYLLLSLFPLLVIVVSVIGLLARDPSFQAQVVDQISTLLPGGSGVDEQVEQIVAGIARPRSGVVGLVGLLGALWAASGVFGAVRKALNNAFDVPVGQSFIRGRLHDLLSVIAVVLMALASTTLTATLAFARAWVSRWVDSPLTNVGWGLVYLLLPLALSFTFFVLLYWLIPNQRLYLRDLWIGALIAGLGFELAKALFTVYLANFANFTEVYGALGSMIALLVFVYIVANIAIFGAEVASEIAKERAG